MCWERYNEIAISPQEEPFIDWNQIQPKRLLRKKALRIEQNACYLQPIQILLRSTRAADQERRPAHNEKPTKRPRERKTSAVSSIGESLSSEKNAEELLIVLIVRWEQVWSHVFIHRRHS